jgi:putative ABC transport system permease protein
MLRHLLQLTWKRKSRNLMLSLEILLAFVIVFGIAAFGLRYWQLYREPIGFDGTDTWSASMLFSDVPAEAITPCAAACSNCRRCGPSAS